MKTTKLKEFIKHLREIKSKAESMHSETNSKNINVLVPRCSSKSRLISWSTNCKASKSEAKRNRWKRNISKW